MLQSIRLSFIAMLNSTLCDEFPVRQRVSQMTLVDRSRLYSAVSQVARPLLSRQFHFIFLKPESRFNLLVLYFYFQVITAPLEPCEPVAFVWHGRSVTVAFRVLSRPFVEPCVFLTSSSSRISSSWTLRRCKLARQPSRFL